MGVVRRFASSLCCGGAAGSKSQAGPPSAEDLEQTASEGSVRSVAGLDVKGSVDSQEMTLRRASVRSARSEMSRTFSDHVSLKQKGEDTLTPTLSYPAGEPLTKSNAAPDIIVVRGKHWRWGDEDGGAGKPGRILSVDRRSGTITVHWQSTGLVETHYRFGKRGCSDLSLAEGFNSTDSSQSKMLAMFRRQLHRVPARNSQIGFADQGQTVIIFDWDDTLFPSTFVRSDAKLNLSRPLRDQKLSAQERKAVVNSLAACAASAERLLRLACSYGKVVVVTLARSPWVDESCKLFYGRIGSLMKQLQVRVVYAQEKSRVEGRKAVHSMTASEVESFWSAVKGRAIEEEVKQFYSKYEGQSWKNIISIGDSNFERLGTMKAAATYMRDKGIEVPPVIDETIRNGLVNNTSADVGRSFQPNEAAPVVVEGQTFHVRIKVLKMVEEPTVEELTVELGLVQQWLPLMVQHDGGFTVDLAGVQNWDQAKAVEESLAARPAPAMTRNASIDAAAAISGYSGSDGSIRAAESCPSSQSKSDQRSSARASSARVSRSSARSGAQQV